MHNKPWMFLESEPSSVPNYFVTRNDKEKRRISNIQPQKKYNSYTSELLNWTGPDSTLPEALYKPEEFDSSKKYPIIFFYYELSALGVYNYLRPEWNGSTHINIPFWTSQGYLVFCPDTKVLDQSNWLNKVEPGVSTEEQGILPFGICSKNHLPDAYGKCEKCRLKSSIWKRIENE